MSREINHHIDSKVVASRCAPYKIDQDDARVTNK